MKERKKKGWDEKREDEELDIREEQKGKKNTNGGKNRVKSHQSCEEGEKG